MTYLVDYGEIVVYFHTDRWKDEHFHKRVAAELNKSMKKAALIPIRLDTAVLDSDHAWAIDLRKSRDIFDFSDWKDPGSFKDALDRLLRALKADN